MTGHGPDIANGSNAEGRAAEPGLSLLFARGCRPSLPDIRALAVGWAEAADPPVGFAFGHQPADAEGWVELLVSGLSFDLTGLLPAAPAPQPLRRHGFGLDGPELPDDLEAVRIMPAPHIIAGAALPPVVRIMTGLAVALTRLGNVRAVCWHPAQTVVETKLFVRIVGSWLAGGAFPALGLTALIEDTDGGVRSEGLAFFIGQELRIEPDPAAPRAETAKLAVRLIHRLIEDGPVASVDQLIGHDGSLLDAEPSLDGRLLRIWRRT